MPIFWFALSEVSEVANRDALLIFVILHLLVYPASNGYNSYMDRDTNSVGGIKNPMQPTAQLFYTSVGMDALALVLSFFISTYFTLGLLMYILASRAYSYRGIRLKKYPVLGYLTVIFFQGAIAFLLVIHGASIGHTLQVSLLGMVAASLLVGGFYPLTQIYQHQQDRADGVVTLSMLLGYRGTFIFTAAIYALAMLALGLHLIATLQERSFYILQIFFLPVLVYFFWWMRKVWKDESAANFANTMRMNVLASVCTNAAFITLYLIEKF
jgi:1,4-dihydroxy-2-naphthoate polyprenyltransferase